MARSWKHKILPALLAGTLTFSFGAAVHADSDKNESGKGKGKAYGQQLKWNQGNNKVEIKVDQGGIKFELKFNDVKQHWAQDIISQMVAYKIINGYADSTFRPDKHVTQLEAIIMVMNLLEQKTDLLKDGDDYIGNNVPSWAKDKVKLALYNDIVDWEDIKNFNKPATRMFVIKLLVNALGADLDNMDDDNLFFQDIAGLNSEDKAYLSYALLQALVEGYQDKTVKPNKPVTRAEMAAFVNRLFDKVGDGDNDDDYNYGTRVKGTISGIDEDDEELIIGSKTYQVTADTTVKIDGRTADFDDLDVGMRIEAILEDDDDNELETIYAYTKNAADDVEFKIEKVSDSDDDFEEAVITGSEVDDVTPDLSDEQLTIKLNGSTSRVIDLDEIDGTQDDGFEVADELEEAIAEALNNSNRVKVTFEDNNDRFIFETDNSPSNVVPTIQFDGDEDVLDALGLSDDVAEGSLGEQSWKIQVETDAEDDQTFEIEIEGEIDGLDVEETVEFSVDENDSAEDIADKIADALDNNSDIVSAFDISVSGDEVTLTTDGTEDVDVEIRITEK